MPLLAAVVILSLGVGIGANLVVFSWLQAVVLQPLPGVADARHIYFVEPRAETGHLSGRLLARVRDYRERLRSFESLLAFRPGAVQHRRSREQRADVRAAGLGQLLHARSG